MAYNAVVISSVGYVKAERLKPRKDGCEVGVCVCWMGDVCVGWVLTGLPPKMRV